MDIVQKISPLPSPKRLRAGRSPLFACPWQEKDAKEGYYSSLLPSFSCRGQAGEVRRDFTNQCLHYFETVNNLVGPWEGILLSFAKVMKLVFEAFISGRGGFSLPKSERLKSPLPMTKR
jgi:hypothetical protein